MILLTLLDKSSLLKAAAMVDQSAEATLYNLPLDNWRTLAAAAERRLAQRRVVDQRS
jgi:hypothetical protein